MISATATMQWSADEIAEVEAIFPDSASVPASKFGGEQVAYTHSLLAPVADVCSNFECPGTHVFREAATNFRCRCVFTLECEVPKANVPAYCPTLRCGLGDCCDVKAICNTHVCSKGMRLKATAGQVLCASIECSVNDESTCCEPVPLPPTPVQPFCHFIGGTWLDPAGNVVTIRQDTDSCQFIAASPGQAWSPAGGSLQGEMLAFAGQIATIGEDGLHIEWPNGAVWMKGEQGRRLEEVV
jgi:hypothetical protein